MRVGMKVSDVATSAEMGRSGLGFGVLFDDTITGSEGLVRMRMLTREGVAMKRKTSMVYHADSLKIRPVRQFVEFIEERRYGGGA